MFDNICTLEPDSRIMRVLTCIFYRSDKCFDRFDIQKVANKNVSKYNWFIKLQHPQGSSGCNNRRIMRKLTCAESRSNKRFCRWGWPVLVLFW